MPYTVAICDDDAADAAGIAKQVQAWSDAANQPVQIKTFPSAEAFLFAYEEESVFDILLLDVEMGAMSGIGLAKKLRGQNSRAQIVFITSHAELSGEGYEVEALHWRVKPVAPQKLNEVLDKAAARLRVQPRAVIISCEGETLCLSEPDILYAEAFLHYTVVYTANAQYRIKESISVFEKLLSGDFFRIHRSYVVSLKAVVRFTRTEVELNSGRKLPLSRTKYEELTRAFLARH